MTPALVMGYLLIGSVAVLLLVVMSPAQRIDGPGKDALCALVAVALWPLVASAAIVWAVGRWSEWW